MEKNLPPSHAIVCHFLLNDTGGRGLAKKMIKCDIMGRGGQKKPLFCD